MAFGLSHQVLSHVEEAWHVSKLHVSPGKRDDRVFLGFYQIMSAVGIGHGDDGSRKQDLHSAVVVHQHLELRQFKDSPSNLNQKGLQRLLSGVADYGKKAVRLTFQTRQSILAPLMAFTNFEARRTGWCC